MTPDSSSLSNMPTDPNQPPEARGARPNGEQNSARAKWLIGLAGLLLLFASRFRQFLISILAILIPGITTGPAVSREPRPTPVKGHEKRDANAKWIFGIIIFLFVFGLSIHGILAGFLGSLKRGRFPSDRWRPVQTANRAQPVRPAFPRLQVSPPLDLQTFRAREDAELQSYGWINQTSGIVRIPIDRAMDSVLQQGLPTRSSTNQNQSGPSTYQLMQRRAEHPRPEIKEEK